jgi:AcrR family transcriptional regulator
VYIGVNVVRPNRSVQHLDLHNAIKETAWSQISQLGAASLSLRSIARELKITAPAIYNYFPRREDLITALIIDAYTSFGDWQYEARDSVATADLTGRFRSTGLSYRNWALKFPQRYQLIFGTPIPGYVAPHEKVLPFAARSLGALVSIMEEIRKAGRLNIDHFPQVSPGYEAAFEVWQSFSEPADSLSLSVAILIWTQVHGLVSLEIANNLPPFGLSGDALYMYELDVLEKTFIK